MSPLYYLLALSCRPYTPAPPVSQCLSSLFSVDLRDLGLKHLNSTSVNQSNVHVLPYLFNTCSCLHGFISVRLVLQSVTWCSMLNVLLQGFLLPNLLWEGSRHIYIKVLLCSLHLTRQIWTPKRFCSQGIFISKNRKYRTTCSHKVCNWRELVLTALPVYLGVIFASCVRLAAVAITHSRRVP